jgi:glycosyltransferase involved in cell wall biosynthesis
MDKHALADLVCLSHLRWDFVFQRPQHLMTRWAKHARVFYVEEPIEHDIDIARLEMRPHGDQLTVAVPHIPRGLSLAEARRLQRELLETLVETEGLSNYVLWYYTPIALPITRSLSPRTVVYDCMDQLSAFRGAPPELELLERHLLDHADVVMAGGYSLYRAKQKIRNDVHLFPSSVDIEHFRQARLPQPDPDDQKDIPHQRLGFFGVLDERMDIALLAEVAERRPDWHLVVLGPVTKIDPATLPRAANIHYLGQKSYAELPRYIAGWDVAILPFARNDSTRYISPTKTPEYLAAGRPVVSTSIADVVEPYGRLQLVQIADAPSDFVRAVERALAQDPVQRRADADVFLAGNSWDTTFGRMADIIDTATRARHRRASRPELPSADRSSRSPLPLRHAR